MKKFIRIMAGLCIVLFIYGCINFKSERYIRDRVVKLSSAKGMCTGEQIRAPSGVDYILSAAHCRVMEDSNGNMLITTEDGRQMLRRIIAEDSKSDLLLIEGVPGLRGLNIANGYIVSEHVRTFTHGHNMPTYKTEGELLALSRVMIGISEITSPEEEQACKSKEKNSIYAIKLPEWMGGGDLKVCVLDVLESVTTAKIVPGSSGGPVVDNSGDLVGVCSATDEIGFGYLVSLKDIRAFINNY